ncbi:AraC family transcriptional regulator [Bacteroides sp. 51]|uniref:AraC family transcriptional regulator n=1 Tax=Bacteroides sp. 51 TaxID=2302938 RepID=UPI0013D19820|nr:AraC family transcriptional regulator [Bacteroides sp. 51]
MGNSYTKLSFDKIRRRDPNTINYSIFSENARLPIDMLFKEPFIVEGLVLGLCIKGSAKIKISFNEYELKPDTVFVLIPSQVVHLVENSEDFLIESLYISFDFMIGLPLEQDFDSAFNLRKRPCINISSEAMQNLLEYFTFIVKQYNRAEQPYRDTIIKGLIFSLLAEFTAIYKNNAADRNIVTTRQEELTNEFLKLLIEDHKEERSVSHYADKLYVTRKHLSATVKQVTGRTVLEWIHAVFITTTKVLLKNSNKTIAEISEELNFSSPSFFCRLFKTHAGMSPMEYRNLN